MTFPIYLSIYWILKGLKCFIYLQRTCSDIFLNFGSPTPLSAQHWYDPPSRRDTSSIVSSALSERGLALGLQTVNNDADFMQKEFIKLDHFQGHLDLPSWL